MANFRNFSRILVAIEEVLRIEVLGKNIEKKIRVVDK